MAGRAILLTSDSLFQVAPQTPLANAGALGRLCVGAASCLRQRLRSELLEAKVERLSAPWKRRCRRRNECSARFQRGRTTAHVSGHRLGRTTSLVTSAFLAAQGGAGGKSKHTKHKHNSQSVVWMLLYQPT